ncbi:MAG: hypothetical protein CMJ49_04120 [Planctomycetaceae bacterium]|nr:hypothetical protein [Planctomycetaceae bacterium]
MSFQDTARQFHTEGFAIVRDVFTPAELAEIEAALDYCLTEVGPTLEAGEIYYESTPARPIKSMFRLQQYHRRMAYLLTDRRLHELVQTVYDDPDVVIEQVGFFGKPARDGSVTPAHQDNIFQCFDPPDALTLTVAIDASTPDNGPLVCQVGSHELGLLPHVPSGVMGFSQQLIDPLDAQAYPPVEICMNRGDLCLHAVNTVHYSGANQTDRSRRQLAISCQASRAAIDEELMARRKAILAQLHADHE